MTDLAQAGTVVVVRDGAHGPEVLLVQRPERGSFPGSWVFPGGRVDPEDRHAEGEALVLGVRVEAEHPDASAQDAADLSAAARAAVRETYEEVGLRVSDIVPLSCWTPPEGIPKRLRTWFFVAVDPGESIVPAVDEIVDYRWMRPEDALDEHAADNLLLMPPTWVVLWLLQGHPNADALLTEAVGAYSRRGMEQFHTVVTSGGTESTLSVDAGPLGTGHLFIWDGDEHHPHALGAAGARHRLDTLTRPWQYTRPADR